MEAPRPPPARIVSLNQCLDAILVELVPTERIAAISHYSRDPLRSPIAELAQRLPITYESAEEIVALRPDLVLASRHSAIPTRNALRRVGIHYELFDVAFSVDESLAQIRRIAALVGSRCGRRSAGRPDRDARSTTARLPPGTRRLTAAVYETGGLTAGSNTVTDDLMQIVGLDNLAARYGIKMHAPMQLELLVAAPPDLLLVGEVPAAAGTQAARLVQHRALRKVPSLRWEFPARFMYCSGPTIIEEVAALAARTRRHPYAFSRAGRTMTTRRWIMPSLLALVVLLAVASIAVGRIVLDWNVWLDQDAIGRTILLELRLPRALLGIAIGAALGLAGAALQGYLRNPLADPGTLGVSSMAAFGAVLSIFFGVADLHPWVLPSSGVAGAMLGMAALFLLAGMTASALTLVLSGVILSALAVCRHRAGALAVAEPVGRRRDRALAARRARRSQSRRSVHLRAAHRRRRDTDSELRGERSTR